MRQEWAKSKRYGEGNFLKGLPECWSRNASHVLCKGGMAEGIRRHGITTRLKLCILCTDTGFLSSCSAGGSSR
jgi:hypothetical protein